VVSARNAAALDNLAQGTRQCLALPLDATDPVAVKHAAAHLLARGPLDCVVYCAGHYEPMRAHALDLAAMRRHCEVNYLGALYLLDAVLPALRARGQGHVSLVGSVAGYGGLPNSLAYGPTKAALINLAEALYLDLQAARSGCVHHQSGLCADAADGAKQLQNAGPADTRPRRPAPYCRDGHRGSSRSTFPNGSRCGSN
jgi:NAD(P)-dependent dehydrogenase (short-subunit alcohol dehydrogenase family)